MPTVRERGSGDDDFEILELTNEGRNWLQQMFRELGRQSTGKQIAVGGVTGWCSGYVCGKIGKAAAAAMGGSLLLMQIAAHQGYITVHWGKLQKSVTQARKKIEQGASKTSIPDVAQEVQDFVKDNIFIAGGFAAGFLLGLSS